MLEVLGIAIHALDLRGHRDRRRLARGFGGAGGSPPRWRLRGGADRARAHPRAAGRPASARSSRPTGCRTGSRPPGRPGATTAVLVEAGTPDAAAAIAVDVAFECVPGRTRRRTPRSGRPRPADGCSWSGSRASTGALFRVLVARRKELALQLVRRMEAADLGRAVCFVAAGRVSLDGLVSHRFALEDALAAFEHLARRAGLKIVVEPGEERLIWIRRVDAPARARPRGQGDARVDAARGGWGGSVRSSWAGSGCCGNDPQGLIHWGMHPRCSGRDAFAVRPVHVRAAVHELTLGMPPHAIHGVGVRPGREGAALIDRDRQLRLDGVSRSGASRATVRPRRGPALDDLVVEADEPMLATVGWQPWFRRSMGEGTPKSGSRPFDAGTIPCATARACQRRAGLDCGPSGRRVHRRARPAGARVGRGAAARGQLDLFWVGRT